MAELAIRMAGRIEAPLELVWAMLVDLGASAEWLDDVEAVAVDDPGRPRWRAGARWIEGRVLEVAPPGRLRLGLAGVTRLVADATLSVELRPAELGTGFALEIDAAPTGLGRALGPWIRFRAEVALLRAIRGFRSAAEQAHAARRRRSAARSTRRPAPAAARAAALPEGEPERAAGG